MLRRRGYPIQDLRAGPTGISYLNSISQPSKSNRHDTTSETDNYFLDKIKLIREIGTKEEFALSWACNKESLRGGL